MEVRHSFHILAHQGMTSRKEYRQVMEEEGVAFPALLPRA